MFVLYSRRNGEEASRLHFGLSPHKVGLIKTRMEKDCFVRPYKGVVRRTTLLFL